MPAITIVTRPTNEHLVHVAATALDDLDVRISVKTDPEWRVQELIAAAPALVLIDVPEPATADWKKIRHCASTVPTICVLHSSRETGKLRVYAAGAADVVSWPASAALLRAQVLSVLRIAQMGAATFIDDHLQVDLRQRRVVVSGADVHLRPSEFRLLAILLRRRDQVLTHEILVREMWGVDDPTRIPNIQVYASRLRSKLEPNPNAPRYIQTVHKIGYRFQGRQAEHPDRKSAER